MAPVNADKLAKTLELIHQLLATAANTPYPEEADTAQKQAEKLMIRYGIDKAQLDVEAGRQGKPREQMIEKRFEVSGIYRLAQTRGLYAVALAFNSVEVLESNFRNRSTLYLIGAESDVDQILRLFTSLVQQATTAMTAWWLTVDSRSYPSRQAREHDKRQFQLMFYATVAQRLQAIYGVESTGAELVLANRRDRAKEYANSLHPVVKAARPSKMRAGSYRASVAGMAAGERADVYGGNLGTQNREPLTAL